MHASSKLLISKIQFLAVVGLSFLFPFWLLAAGHSQLLAVVLWPWHMPPPDSKPAMAHSILLML